MINKKILAILLLFSFIVAWIWNTFADNSNNWKTSTWFINKWFSWEKHFIWEWIKINSDDRKNIEENENVKIIIKK